MSLEYRMVKIVSVAAILGLTISVAAMKASAQTPEEALATIEKNFAQMQITKNEKTIENTSTATWDGQNAGGSFVWFDVFEKRNGRWMWIVSQSSKADLKIAAKISCDKSICATSHPGFSLK